jgi:hypothetical protein
VRILILLICGLIVFTSPIDALAENQQDTGAGIHFFINPISGPEEVYIELFLTNDSEKTMELEARTSQLYEITVQNEDNEMVYKYSEGRFFLQALQKIILKQGETKNWIEKINKGKSLKPGTYKVKAQLLATPINNSSKITYEDEAIFVVPAENPIIKNVKVIKKDDSYVITGKVKSTTSILYYVVEDGHHEWIEEKRLRVSLNSNWEDFNIEIKLPKDMYPDQLPLILYLYEKDKSGNMIHTYPKLLK